MTVLLPRSLASLVDRKPMACPKSAPRVEEKSAKDQKAGRDAAQFRAAVWLRDGGRCRICGRKVSRTLELVPNRGEVHHVRGRNVTPNDRCNVNAALLLCAICHGKCQRHELKAPKP